MTKRTAAIIKISLGVALLLGAAFAPAAASLELRGMLGGAGIWLTGWATPPAGKDPLAKRVADVVSP